MFMLCLALLDIAYNKKNKYTVAQKNWALVTVSQRYRCSPARDFSKCWPIFKFFP